MMETFYKEKLKWSKLLVSVLIIGILVGIASIFYVSILNEAKDLKRNESFCDNTYLFC